MNRVLSETQELKRRNAHSFDLPPKPRHLPRSGLHSVCSAGGAQAPSAAHVVSALAHRVWR